jgi:HAD superfamily hydrolase (TIGR01662 family)
VKHPDEFEFLPDVPDAVAAFAKRFGRIVIVTNQQGIGKGFYTEVDLARVHEKMHAGFAAAQAKVDAVYFAPQLSRENSPMRKPGIGMALKAKEDFPEIDFSRSIMVGDSGSDLEFAANAGMFAVYVGEEIPAGQKAEFCVSSLTEFAEWLGSGL